ncbi:hypothetical protein ECC37_07950 [Helicobacter pylori]|nr:hypothetical protein ECC37_07950 [Helicobacter pylori]
MVWACSLLACSNWLYCSVVGRSWSSLMVLSLSWILFVRVVFSCFRVLSSFSLAWSSCFVGRSWSSSIF